ncbi:Odorant receptor 308 [Nylanderia fulva]|uniref:Odorant receptor n=2 Tax=Nylanderia fulva TaxID=613905 RepID=A0A6G1LPN9_9HYME|nr:Odorant receptor 308 [Nylanderia fulva]
MICIETQHFKINRILLLLIGLWPYQRTFLVELQLITLLGILTTFIIFQFTTFITSEYTMNLMYKVVSNTFFFLTFLIKYNSFWINADILRSSMKQLQEVYDEIKDKNEIAIVQKYGSKANRITIQLISLGLFSLSVVTLSDLGPYIYNIVTNQSLPFHIVTEYFIDQEKYSYLIMLHIEAAYWIGAIAMIATGTTLITYLQLTCAMFSIACYRIEQAIRILQKGNFENERKSCEEIIRAVNIHCKAMKLCNFLISNFVGSFFFLTAAGLVCLSCNLLQIVLLHDNIEQLIQSLIMITVHYVYLFLSNYIAQEITDHNEYVFVTVYNVHWYRAPIRVQRMILFLLQKGTKSFNLVLGGIFVASLKSAASLMSTSISYFTVLYSTRQD